MENTPTLHASAPAGNLLDAVAVEIADLTSTMTARIGRTPRAAELMALNVERNDGPVFTRFRKAVENALILQMNAEIDAKLAELHAAPDPKAARIEFFRTRVYPRTEAQIAAQLRREELHRRLAEIGRQMQGGQA